MSDSSKIKLAILWHMHQPDYRDPESGVMCVPWVRLHATKDYLDMVETAASYENIKVTFNLVPSLIEQIQHYIDGGTDNHLEITRLNPADSNGSLKPYSLATLFNCNVDKMIRPHHRFNQLYEKWKAGQSGDNKLTLTADEIRDTQVWSNLVWVDPSYKNESAIKQLFEKSENFTEADKLSLIDWQLSHIKKIIPAYREALKQGRIEISFSPYFHPILPLLCDFNSAREAIKDITLPKQKFQHPEDARYQIEKSKELYKKIFDSDLTGMWPSEGSISDEAVRLCSECGIKWLASDEQVLFRSIQKSGLDLSSNHQYRVYEHESGVKLLFRDHMLSDKIGFVYSNWDADKAASDFIAQVKDTRNRLNDFGDGLIVPVILDGENAWEYFANDGNDFLNALYEKLSNDSEIETVAVTDAVEQLPATKLSSVFAGSWINHNFRIWIGHEEDNTAWDYLSETRNFLEKFQQENPDYDSIKLTRAWRHIYIAEGSDWFWWYGDEHRGPDNHRFDLMFRNNLISVYRLLESEPPQYLRIPIISQTYGIPVQSPDALVTPNIDGKISHFYEWFGSGIFECVSSDTTMHRVFRLLSRIHFGFDHDNFYARLDFSNTEELKSVANLRIDIFIYTENDRRITIEPDKLPFATTKNGQFKCVLADILELSVSRNFLWTDSFGKLALRVEISDKDKVLEQWPENGTIDCEIPEKNKELFWHQN